LRTNASTTEAGSLAAASLKRVPPIFEDGRAGASSRPSRRYEA
jgi:hypothetical protein